MRSSFKSARKSIKALADDGALADDVTSQEYIAKLLDAVEDDLDEANQSDSSSTYSTGHSQAVETLTMDDHRQLRELESDMLRKEELSQKVERQCLSENSCEHVLHNQQLATENVALRCEVEKLRNAQMELQQTIEEQRHTLTRVVRILDPKGEQISEINKLRKQLRKWTDDLNACHDQLNMQSKELQQSKEQEEKHTAQLDDCYQALACHNKLRRTIGRALHDIEDYSVEQLLEELNPLIQHMNSNRGRAE
ncbi:hypothetical protein FB446DRAFT_707147 [Lentinula raphanica]|nr:hypothetical protein FB446DRAFT_707147 [Lentinula raphanica]